MKPNSIAVMSLHYVAAALERWKMYISVNVLNKITGQASGQCVGHPDRVKKDAG